MTLLYGVRYLQKGTVHKICGVLIIPGCYMCWRGEPQNGGKQTIDHVRRSEFSPWYNCYKIVFEISLRYKCCRGLAQYTWFMV